MRFQMMIAAAALWSASPAAMAQDEAEPDRAVQAVQAHVDAYRTGNLERFLTTFAPDAVVVANGVVATGRNEIRELYRMNFIPGAPSIRIVESGKEGETVYLTIAYTFADGGERCCSYSQYTVRNGRIVYLEAHG